MSDVSTSQAAPIEPDAQHWTARYGKPIIFTIIPRNIFGAAASIGISK